MSFYYKDWCTYKDDVVTINTYDDYECNDSYIEALMAQAKAIDDTKKNLAMFISGGIDSQTKALGFIKAGIPIEFVTIKQTYEGKSNDLELFYTIQFCKKYNVDLTIYEVGFTKESLRQMVLEQDYLHSPIGSGFMFQADAIRKFTEETGKQVVTGHGGFMMSREANICSGHFWKPDKGLIETLDMDNTIIFDMYAPYVFKYYEMIHRREVEVQILKNYEGKNLAYTELGMPFRPKLHTWEFLSNEDYSKLNTINFSNPHCQSNRLPGVKGKKVILNTLGITDEAEVKRFSDNKPKLSSDVCEVKLYSFETEHQFPY